MAVINSFKDHKLKYDKDCKGKLQNRSEKLVNNTEIRCDRTLNTTIANFRQGALKNIGGYITKSYTAS